MYIYNVTTNIDESIHKKWKQWMQEEHIPSMLATGKFSKALMSKVLIEEEMGGVTYSVQYTAKSKEDLLQYYQENRDAINQKTLQLFPNSFADFSTEMQIVNEFTASK